MHRFLLKNNDKVLDILTVMIIFLCLVLRHCTFCYSVSTMLKRLSERGRHKLTHKQVLCYMISGCILLIEFIAFSNLFTMFKLSHCPEMALWSEEECREFESGKLLSCSITDLGTWDPYCRC